MAVRYLPAPDASQVGGDWYDAFSLSDGATALAIGDVVGHDLEAAAGMAQVRNMLRAYAWALHANGRDQEALVEVQKALELGTRSALTHYHAGMINLSLGRADAARTELTTALGINPFFDPLAAPIARQTLTMLGVSA